MSTQLAAIGRSLAHRVFPVAIILGFVLGVVLSLEPQQRSRWVDFESISLGMTRDQVRTQIDSSDKSQTGCGSHRFESQEAVCRFEDPWRSYLIGFDLTTKNVNRKHFYFKRIPPLRLP
jgi:hypothetical protein